MKHHPCTGPPATTNGASSSADNTDGPPSSSTLSQQLRPPETGPRLSVFTQDMLELLVEGVTHEALLLVQDLNITKFSVIFSRLFSQKLLVHEFNLVTVSCGFYLCIFLLVVDALFLLVAEVLFLILLFPGNSDSFAQQTARGLWRKIHPPTAGNSAVSGSLQPGYIGPGAPMLPAVPGVDILSVQRHDSEQALSTSTTPD